MLGGGSSNNHYATIFIKLLEKPFETVTSMGQMGEPLINQYEALAIISLWPINGDVFNCNDYTYESLRKKNASALVVPVFQRAIASSEVSDIKTRPRDIMLILSAIY
jgi:hypothetical protein